MMKPQPFGRTWVRGKGPEAPGNEVKVDPVAAERDPTPLRSPTRWRTRPRSPWPSVALDRLDHPVPLDALQVRVGLRRLLDRGRTLGVLAAGRRSAPAASSQRRPRPPCRSRGCRGPTASGLWRGTWFATLRRPVAGRTGPLNRPRWWDCNNDPATRAAAWSASPAAELAAPPAGRPPGDSRGAANRLRGSPRRSPVRPRLPPATAEQVAQQYRVPVPAGSRAKARPTSGSQSRRRRRAGPGHRPFGRRRGRRPGGRGPCWRPGWPRRRASGRRRPGGPREAFWASTRNIAWKASSASWACPRVRPDAEDHRPVAADDDAERGLVAGGDVAAQQVRRSAAPVGHQPGDRPGQSIGYHPGPSGGSVDHTLPGGAGAAPNFLNSDGTDRTNTRS